MLKISQIFESLTRPDIWRSTTLEVAVVATRAIDAAMSSAITARVTDNLPETAPW